MATESKPVQLDTSIPEFKLKGTDGRLHSLEDYAASKILVVGFTCNHCPYVQAYESRLMELVNKFKSKAVSFICINSNDEGAYPEDSFENMKKRAQSLGFNFDYLRDETQVVARAFNAACTPEFYVYDSSRKLKYHGRLDDNHKDMSAIKYFYLSDAIEDLLNSRSPRLAQTAAMGCSIKWKP